MVGAEQVLENEEKSRREFLSFYLKEASMR